MEWVIIGLILGLGVPLLIGIIIFNFKVGLLPQILGPDEMAIFVFVGEPKDFRDSGFHLIPLFFGTSLKRFPKKMYNLDYPARDAITRRGTSNEIEYGAQVLKVDSVAYVSFPQRYAWGKDWTDTERRVNSQKEIEEIEKDGRKAKRDDSWTFQIQGGLVQILRSQVPIKDEELKNFTEEAIVGALRVAIGKVTWREATEEIEDVRKAAEEVFKSSDGALLTAGFHPDALKLAIEEIKLPRELEQALPEPDKARLDAQAAKFVAETRAIETVGTVIEMMAESRGKTPKEIQDSIEADLDAQREFLDLSQDLVKRRMALDGKSFVDIRVEGAEGIEKTLLDLVAAWKRMPDGEKETGEKKGGKKVRVPGGSRMMSDEERRRRGIL